MMGARVSGLRVGKSGGQIRTSKNNWLITLAPYFFPFYAVLFIIAFFLADLVWGLEKQIWTLFFLVGLGWSFHISFTLFTLFTARQPDVTSQGWVFSMVVIFAMNLATMLLSVVILSTNVSFGDVALIAREDLGQAYGWVLDKLWSLWQSRGQ